MLFILNRTEEIVGVLHNNGDTSKVTPYFEDVHTEELETGAETFEFKTIANTKEGYYLQVGNYIAFRDEEDYKVFTITEVEEEHEEVVYKRVYCEGVCLELLNDVLRPRNFASTNITNFMKSILADTSWTLGIVDMAIVGVQSIDITDYVSVYKALQDYVIGTFECEIKFRIQIANHRIVGRYIDVYKQRGNVTKKRFEYGVNMTKVKRTVDTSELVTALIGVGNNGTTFKSVTADDKPLNQDFIVDQDAFDRWNNNGKHIMGTYKHDTESPQELLLHTRKELKRRAIPKITYDLDVELLGDNVGLGDTVFVIDTDFSPQLLLSARVSVLEKSQTDGNSNKCKLANFKEVRSNITDDMREIANQLQGTIEDKINSKFPVTSENLGNGAVTEGKIEPQYLSMISADIVMASKIEVEDLIANKAEVEDLKVVNAEIKKLQAVDIDVTGKLTATEGEIKKLKGQTAEFEHIFSGNITANMIQTGTIQANSGIFANGAIGSAEISDLSASKLSSGTIDTTNIDIQGKNGMLKLRGNRLQVFTGTGNQRYERVSLGDVYNDGSYYGLLVRGSDGNTVLFDENGITEKGITDGLITNEHISGETQIDGAKLDISSVIREINGDTEKINGHAILIEGSTLSAKLSEIINTQTEDGKIISSHSSKIEANERAIILKVDSQTYTQDKNTMEETLKKNTSSIEQLEKDIKLKVEQTDINTAITNTKTELTANLNGFKTQVSKDYYTKSDVDGKGYATSSSVEQTVDDLKIKFQESGGYNILFNGDFKRGTEFWSVTSGLDVEPPSNVGNGMGSENGLDIRLHAPNHDKDYFFVQYITDTEFLNYKEYTLSAQMLVSFDAETNVDALVEMYSRIVYHDGTKEYKRANIDMNNVEVWQKPSVTFKPHPNKRVTELTCTFKLSKTNKYVYISQAMLEKGSMVSAWSPHPNEISQGIITVDRNGIIVENSSVDTKTVMDAESFRVENSQNQTIAEFSVNSNIPNLTANTIISEKITANNVVDCNIERDAQTYTWYVDSATGNDNNSGGSASAPLKTLQQAIDNLPMVLTRHQRIVIKGNHSSTNIRTLHGHGILTLEFADNFVMNGRLLIEGVSNRLRLTCTTVGKATFKGGISLWNCACVDVYGLNMNGEYGTEGCMVYIKECNYVALNSLDFVPLSNGTTIEQAVKVYASNVWTHNLIGSKVKNVISQYAFSVCYIAKIGTIKVPDYTGAYHYGADGGGRYQAFTGAVLSKTPSKGYAPNYTPTQKTRTWSFNNIYSTESLHGYGTKQELIQGYASAWSTGRWTGYMKMTDDFGAIRNELSGATNLSGRLYVQRKTSSGNATGSKLCLYGSDNVAITTTQTINRGQGVWVTLSSAVVEKIKNGTIKYFYLKADSNNTATYFKCESNAKIELSYKS